MSRVAVLLTLLMAIPSEAPARRHRPHHQHPRLRHQHAWQRPLGHRLQTWRRRTRQERKRFRFVKPGSVPISSDKALGRIEALSAMLQKDPRAYGAKVERMSAPGARYAVYRVDIPALKLSKRGRGRIKQSDKKPPLKVVISSWIHGDEPVGHKAAEQLIRYALKHPDWRDDKHLRFVLKIDPYGTRDTPDGVNVNRNMRKGTRSRVARDIKKAVGHGEVGLALDLHASQYDGSFLIQLADYGNLSRRIASAMRSYSLLDADPKVGRYAHPNEPKKLGYHLSAPGVARVPGTRPGPEGLGSMMEHMGGLARYSFTLEASQAVPPARRVRDLVKLSRSAIDNTLRYGER